MQELRQALSCHPLHPPSASIALEEPSLVIQGRSTRCTTRRIDDLRPRSPEITAQMSARTAPPIFILVQLIVLGVPTNCLLGAVGGVSLGPQKLYRWATFTLLFGVLCVSEAFDSRYSFFVALARNRSRSEKSKVC